MNTCPHCSVSLGSVQGHCAECGMIIETGIECEIHADCYAVGICVVCGQPMCSECAMKADGKFFCTRLDHRLIYREWQIVHCPESEFEADAILQNLHLGGIEAKAFALHDHSALLRLVENRVRVYVRKTEIAEAMALLSSLKLLGAE